MPFSPERQYNIRPLKTRNNYKSLLDNKRFKSNKKNAKKPGFNKNVLSEKVSGQLINILSNKEL